MFIRFNDNTTETIRAKSLGPSRAQLLEIPRRSEANLYDVVRFDVTSAREDYDGTSYRMLEVLHKSGYQAYLTWGVVRKPRAFGRWAGQMKEKGMVVRADDWVTRRVRKLFLAIPSELPSLQALVWLNRHARMVEVICPLLAAHADDWERAKSDLERAVAWGAPDAELSMAVAQAFEEEQRWDEAMPFWERVAHALPRDAAAREQLAISYARLGVYPYAANEFDRAAYLTDDPDHRRRLEEARDLMWERSRV